MLSMSFYTDHLDHNSQLDEQAACQFKYKQYFITFIFYSKYNVCLNNWQAGVLIGWYLF